MMIHAKYMHEQHKNLIPCFTSNFRVVYMSLAWTFMETVAKCIKIEIHYLSLCHL